ncbi:MAG: phosphate ABC transporter permease PstA [Firmicutes bacterium]|uniref:Phosphate transport system permease protein PstA n=1 Tax=Candidatus Alloenteromonas pullistercoris TaxID=2840785 RepID=A0A9D9GW69_9FIRM|nr:phosphate ABC transporter permease PstA [Candidatus Enteromonas pullistercoris]
MLSVESFKRRRIAYYGYRAGSYLSLFISLAALLGLVLYIAIQGAPELSFSLLFGEYSSAHPSLGPAFLGTLYLILISLGVATPIGMMSAIFLSEYAKGNSIYVKVIRIAIETLSGIPSIVYGLFGYLLFVYYLGWGYSLLGGSFTMALMILPVLVRGIEESLRSVPSSIREASFALGAGKADTTFKIVLPCAIPGIITSIILSVGRVLSESAVLLVTVGMVVNKVPSTPLSSGTSLALDIYYFSSYGYREEASATSFVLLLLVLLLDGLALLLGKLLSKGKGYER